jgi:hypothetical protein
MYHGFHNNQRIFVIRVGTGQKRCFDSKKPLSSIAAERLLKRFFDNNIIRK